MKETVLVAFSTEKENAPIVARALKTLSAEAQYMPGCLNHTATTTQDNTCMFHVWSTWADHKHWDKYRQSEAMDAFDRRVDGMLHDVTISRQSPLRISRECCL